MPIQSAMSQSMTSIDPGHEFFRSRVQTLETKFAVHEMGKPANEKAPAGRANPLEIAHLYLSYDEKTSIMECRATRHAIVNVVTFRTSKALRILNLCPPLSRSNPFDGNEASWEDELGMFRLIARLGQELAKPTRGTDFQIDYIPTQYLSELAKSIDFDGIAFPSSISEGGKNLVLFHDGAAEIVGAVESRIITKFQLDFSEYDGHTSRT
jgi:RES domain-containing protein